MFYRLTTDGVRQDVSLESTFAGPTPTPCWIIGGGPSLSLLPTAAIAASPAPKFAVNLAGHHLLRPTFWTSYDPTARFHRSIYLDPSVIKFVHRCRAMDLVPETTFKVCESPSLYFFDRDPERGFHNYPELPPGASGSGGTANAREQPAAGKISDWQDSLVQSIEIAWQLGFRTLYLAGCDMVIRPPVEQLQLAAAVNIAYEPLEPLRSFYDRCRQAGLSDEQLARHSPDRQYHFDESKPLTAAAQTDFHYFRVAQYLRLSRRTMALAGLRLISVTPESRLNDAFEYSDVALALDSVHQLVGDPRCESTPGRYTGKESRQPTGLAPMRDFPPHNWPRLKADRQAAIQPPNQQRAARPPGENRKRFREALADPPEVPVPLDQ